MIQHCCIESMFHMFSRGSGLKPRTTKSFDIWWINTGFSSFFDTEQLFLIFCSCHGILFVAKYSFFVRKTLELKLIHNNWLHIPCMFFHSKKSTTLNVGPTINIGHSLPGPKSPKRCAVCDTMHIQVDNVLYAVYITYVHYIDCIIDFYTQYTWYVYTPVHMYIHVCIYIYMYTYKSLTWYVMINSRIYTWFSSCFWCIWFDPIRHISQSSLTLQAKMRRPKRLHGCAAKCWCRCDWLVSIGSIWGFPKKGVPQLLVYSRKSQ